jgi:alpha-amylase
MARLLDQDLGDFAAAPHEVVGLGDGQVTFAREGTLLGSDVSDGSARTLMLTKRFALGGTRAEPTLEVEVELSTAEDAPLAFELDLSFPWNLAGGGHNPDAYYTWHVEGEEQEGPHDEPGDVAGTSAVGFGNRYLGVHVDTHLSRPGRVTWYPIETVSKSEGGYERVYQASSLHLRWPVALAAGASQRFGVVFRVTQTRDLEAEERATLAADREIGADAGVPPELRA